MNAIIIEDEKIAAERLASLISQLAPEIHILAHLNSVEQGKEWFSKNKMPDLIFLDIQLNDGYGFDIIDDFEEHCPIIFTTAYNEYAIRGFKYNGVDYLLKPIDKSDLQKALKKFQKNVAQPQTTSENVKSLFKKEYKRRFMIKIGNQYSVLKIDDIAYFESNEGSIFLVTNENKKYPIEYTLDQLDEILDPIDFYRINRKFIVSVRAVKEIHSYFNSRLLLKLVPKTEEQVIVARERTTKFKKWLDL
ncbi:LytR/AlgR family response regulator transcription factor [Wenyingzhuangia sp. IMCC45574]